MRRALFSFLLLVCAPAFAEVNIAWAHAAIAQNPKGQNAKAVVGAPDGKTTGISDNAFLYVVNFNFFKKHRTTPVNYSDLGKCLGLSDDVINSYDIIAFEGNANNIKGWESSLWFVTDEVHAAAGSFSGDELDADGKCCLNPSQTSPLKFRSGTMPKDRFASKTCFDVTLPAKYPQFASWILIDVPDEIRMDSNEFRIWVSGALVGPNRDPDPDAFGVIRHK